MNKIFKKNLFIYTLIVASVLAAFFIFFDDSLKTTEEISITQVIELSKNPPLGQRVFIQVRGDTLKVESGGKSYKSRKENGSSIYEILNTANVDPANVEVEVKGAGGLSSFLSIALSFLPLILFAGILIFMMSIQHILMCILVQQLQLVVLPRTLHQKIKHKNGHKTLVME